MKDRSVLGGSGEGRSFDLERKHPVRATADVQLQGSQLGFGFTTAGGAAPETGVLSPTQ